MNVIPSERTFSGLKLHASYDWQATAPNTHHCLFLIHHFVHISSITQKPWCACNCVTHQTNLLLPRMPCFMLQVAKQLQPTSYGPIQTSLSCYSYTIKNHNKTLGAYDCSTHQTTALLQQYIFVQMHSKERLMSSCPDHSSTTVVFVRLGYCILTNTEYHT